jgi:hypothetical protein
MDIQESLTCTILVAMAEDSSWAVVCSKRQPSKPGLFFICRNNYSKDLTNYI